MGKVKPIPAPMSDSYHYENLPDSEWEHLGRFDGAEARKVIDRLHAAAVPVRVDFHDGKRLLNEEESAPSPPRRMAQGIYIRVPRPLREQAYALRDEALGVAGLVEGFVGEAAGGGDEAAQALEPGQSVLDINGLRLVCPVDEAAVDAALREMDATEGGGFVSLEHADGGVLQANGNEDFGYFLVHHPGEGQQPLRSELDLRTGEVRAALLGFLAGGSGWRGEGAWAPF